MRPWFDHCMHAKPAAGHIEYDYKHYGRREICWVSQALPRAKTRALSKVSLCRVLHSAKICTRQRVALPSAKKSLALGKELLSAKVFFAECNTRQRRAAATDLGRQRWCRMAVVPRVTPRQRRAFQRWRRAAPRHTDRAVATEKINLVQPCMEQTWWPGYRAQLAGPS